MFSEFKDQVILITGAAGGIGSSLVSGFSKCKAKVYQTDIAEGIGPSYIQGDISDQNFINNLVNQVMEKEGRIDVLVNNVGICLRTPVKDITKTEWQKVMDINLTSLFLLSQAVIEIMIEQKSGAIINLASVAGKVGGFIVGAHYSASKAAIECLTKSLAKTGAPHGVRVNSVAPGIIDTSMQDGIPPEQMDYLLNSIPLGRMGTPTEVVKIIMVLASNLSSYVIGQNININGGMYM